MCYKFKAKHGIPYCKISDIKELQFRAQLLSKPQPSLHGYINL